MQLLTFLTCDMTGLLYKSGYTFVCPEIELHPRCMLPWYKSAPTKGWFLQNQLNCRHIPRIHKFLSR